MNGVIFEWSGNQLNTNSIVVDYLSSIYKYDFCTQKSHSFLVPIKLGLILLPWNLNKYWKLKFFESQLIFAATTKQSYFEIIIVWYFQEPGALPFIPNIRSQFQHVFIIVRAHNPCSDSTQYRLVNIS